MIDHSRGRCSLNVASNSSRSMPVCCMRSLIPSSPRAASNFSGAIGRFCARPTQERAISPCPLRSRSWTVLPTPRLRTGPGTDPPPKMVRRTPARPPAAVGARGLGRPDWAKARRPARAAAVETFEGLVRKKREQSHCGFGHAAASGSRRLRLATRTVLHSVENVEKSHTQLLE